MSEELPAVPVTPIEVTEVVPPDQQQPIPVQTSQELVQRVQAEAPVFVAETTPDEAPQAEDTAAPQEGGEQQPDSNDDDATEMQHDVSHDVDAPADYDFRPEDEGRWDKQKAETMAGVIQQGEGGHLLKRMQWSMDNLDSIKNDPNYVDDQTQRLRDSYQRSVDRGDYYDKRDTLQELEAHERNKQLFYEKQLVHRSQELTAEVNNNLYAFEELYDSNPVRFAQMPTQEFMGVAREYISLIEDVALSVALGASMQEQIEDFQAVFENGIDQHNVTGDESVRVFGRYLADALNWDKKQLEAFNEQLDVINQDSFNKAPRQMAEERLKIVKNNLEAVRKARDELVAKQAQMLGKEPTPPADPEQAPDENAA